VKISLCSAALERSDPNTQAARFGPDKRPASSQKGSLAADDSYGQKQTSPNRLHVTSVGAAEPSKPPGCGSRRVIGSGRGERKVSRWLRT
jgi:hypothetical protein